MYVCVCVCFCCARFCEAGDEGENGGVIDGCFSLCECVCARFYFCLGKGQGGMLQTSTATQIVPASHKQRKTKRQKRIDCSLMYVFVCANECSILVMKGV